MSLIGSFGGISGGYNLIVELLCLGSILLAIGVLVFGPEWFIKVIGEMRKEWFKVGE